METRRATRINLWLQDPSMPLGSGTILSYGRVLPGPRDDEIRICPPQEDVYANPDNDFVFDPAEDPEKARAAHCFAVARIVVDWFQGWQQRNRQAVPGSIRWAGERRRGERVLSIYPQEGHCEDRCQLASFRPGDCSIRLYSSTESNGSGTVDRFAADSFDIVAHEVGHAVLEAQLETWQLSWRGGSEVVAIKESFADLAASLSFLSRIELCSRLLVETRGKGPLAARFFVEFGEEVGRAQGGDSLRQLDQPPLRRDVYPSGHTQGLMLTAPLLRAIDSAFEARAQRDPRGLDALILHALGDQMTDLVIEGFQHMRPDLPELVQVARAILAMAPHDIQQHLQPELVMAFGEEKLG